jgi:ParB/RepB/Spo0J family partition protein
MITKTKSASQPKTEKQLNRGERPPLAKGAASPRKLDSALEVAVLTDADREAAMEVLRTSCGTLCMSCRPKSLPDAIVTLRHELWITRGWKSYPRSGEPQVIAGDVGLIVLTHGRRGIIQWHDVAEAIIDEEEDDEDGSQLEQKVDVEMDDEGDQSDHSHLAEAEDRRLKTEAPKKTRGKKGDGTSPIATGGTPVAEGTPAPEFRDATVPLVLIDPSPHNPRKHFDETALAELAESIRSVGLIEPLIVRTIERGRYELVAGERRWRACKLAGLVTVPVRDAVLTDLQAAEIRIVENLQRKDLTAIEEARGFEELIQQAGYTHKALAEKLGVSEPHVTNRLRLLKLPAKWQKRILSRELPPTHARSLATYAEYPEILKQVEDQVFGQWTDGAPVSLKKFDELLGEAVDEATQELTGNVYSHNCHGSVPIFTPTAGERAKLAIIVVDGEERATNTALWDKLQEAHEKVLIENGSAKAKGGKNGAASHKPKKLTPAQEKAREKKGADELAAWIKYWRSDVIREILSRRVFDDGLLADRAFNMGVAHGHSIQYAERRVYFNLTSRGRGTGLAAIAGDDNPAAVRASLASWWLWNDLQAQHTGRTMPAGAVEALAVAHGVDLEEEWSTNLFGELTRAFFNRHTTAKLVSLCVELGVKQIPRGKSYVLASQAKKSELVQAILTSPETKKKLPRCVTRVAKPKGKDAVEGAVKAAKTRKAKR